MIEQAAWKKCNDWRKLIAELHKKPSVEINWEKAQWNQNKMLWAYLGAYVLLIVSFGAAILVISRVHVLIPPSNSAATSMLGEGDLNNKLKL